MQDWKSLHYVELSKATPFDGVTLDSTKQRKFYSWLKLTVIGTLHLVHWLRTIIFLM